MEKKYLSTNSVLDVRFRSNRALSGSDAVNSVRVSLSHCHVTIAWDSIPHTKEQRIARASPTPTAVVLSESYCSVGLFSPLGLDVL